MVPRDKSRTCAAALIAMKVARSLGAAPVGQRSCRVRAVRFSRCGRRKIDIFRAKEYNKVRGEIMAKENGEWILYGKERNDPARIGSTDELVALIDRVGFLPLFKNRAAGFSVEEFTSAEDWWTGDEKSDPWEWRIAIAQSGAAAYGKFFEGKAGFVSAAWFPRFANFRRDGYDFDSLADEGKARNRWKKLMQPFTQAERLRSYELKALAGFGKGGEANFEGTATDLQMRTYLIARDFRRRLNAKGMEYGWPVTVYATPESLFGYRAVSSAYAEEPSVSREAILAHLRACFPQANGEDLAAVLALR